MKYKNLLFMLIIAVSILSITKSVQAKTYDDYNPAAKCGLLTASTIMTLPYFPVKMAYAFAGAVTAGTINAVTLRYAEPTAEKIAVRSANGDWYITPRILTGEKKLEFNGAVE